MGWEDQGRQERGWFGHGTAPATANGAASDPSVTGMGPEQRALALAYGAIAGLPASIRERVEAQYQQGTLTGLKEAMSAWMKATRLEQSTFAGRLLGREADSPIVRDIHAAALGAATATTQVDLREAATRLADAIKTIGVDRWPLRGGRIEAGARSGHAGDH